MSRICPKCGTELADGTLFCINCGIKLDEANVPESTPTQILDTVPGESKPAPDILASAPAEPVQPESRPYAEAPAPKTSTEAAFGVAPEAPGATYGQPPYQQPYYENPPYQQSPAQCQEPASKPVSVGGFFWLDFLYWIPGIGLLACIIIAIAARNLNVKHHACARLISILVVFVILIILSILTVIAVTQAGINFDEIYRRFQNLIYY